MDATEISPLTEEAIARLLAGRQRPPSEPATNGKRRTPRWPFPGTVQLWIPDEDAVDQHYLATCMNLSLHGLGMMSDIKLPVGLEFTLAVHQPEASFQGRAVIRHCTEVDNRYFIGVQFVFDEP
ncbi:MAG: PilZ domain-containing protein [Planctomycetota bacterium]|jgi:hypothetical protein